MRRDVNPFTFACAGSCSAWPRTIAGAIVIPGNFAMIYSGFEIQSFEAGRGQWHARIQRTDLAPVVIDGLSFPTLEVGFAWSDRDAAMADAKLHIDQNRHRYLVAA